MSIARYLISATACALLATVTISAEKESTTTVTTGLGGLNPRNWERGPDGKLYAPVGKRGKESTPLPDLAPEEPLITINGAPVSWGAMHAHAELLVSDIRRPQGVTMEEFKAEHNNFVLRRIYSVSRNHILKTLLAQEATRRGIVLTAEEVAAKDAEIVAKVKKSRKQGADRYLSVFHAPASFYWLDLTNSLLLGHLENDIIRRNIEITESDIDEAFVKRKEQNRELAAANKTMRPKLEKLREQIIKGEESFEEIAFAESDCDSSIDDGEVGSRYIKELQPPLVDALMKLEPGKISEVVETPYSWHLLRLNKLNRGLPIEGIAVPPPIISINFAHIMLEKKELLPDISREEMAKTLLDEETLRQREELQNELLEKADIETILNMGNDKVAPQASK